MQRKTSLWKRLARGLIVAALFFPFSARADDVCQGQAVELVRNGRVIAFDLDQEACEAQKHCPGETNCQRMTAVNPGTGGIIEWCGCPGQGEPQDCHSRVIHPPVDPRSGRIKEIGSLDCLARCPQREQTCCEVWLGSKPATVGDPERIFNYYGCVCLTVEKGKCPDVKHPVVK
jgi:hypothetical protein